MQATADLFNAVGTHLDGLIHSKLEQHLGRVVVVKPDGKFVQLFAAADGVVELPLTPDTIAAALLREPPKRIDTSPTNAGGGPIQTVQNECPRCGTFRLGSNECDCVDGGMW